ncbi:hypothetical protein [Deinococcus pimensis]|uniref:hypothetical protein n=1 Tax=Deinococcus pimensis TaxID=309888 RepID=UPI00048A216D|nr:hypothetical protein [Deinococcus pimensis]
MPFKLACALVALWTCLLTGGAGAVSLVSVGQFGLPVDAQPLLLARDGGFSVVERRPDGVRVTSLEPGGGESVPLEVPGRLLAVGDRRLLLLGGGRLRIVGAVTGSELASWPSDWSAAEVRVVTSAGRWLLRRGRDGLLVDQRSARRRPVRLPDCPTCRARLLNDGRGDALIALDDAGSGSGAERHWLVRPGSGASVRLGRSPLAVVDNLLFSSSTSSASGLVTTTVEAEETSRYPALFPRRPSRRWGVPPVVRVSATAGSSVLAEGVLWDDDAKFYVFSGQPGRAIYNVSAGRWQDLATAPRLYRLVQDPALLGRVARSFAEGRGSPRFQETSRVLVEATDDRLNVYVRPSYTLVASVALPHARSFEVADVPEGLLLASSREDGVTRVVNGRVTLLRLSW